VPGVSETITVRSIVGRFLEHARIYYFHNAGDAKIYFGSADLMPRNLNGRIEVLAPIISPALKENVMKQIVLPQLKDNIHAWVMRLDGSYVKQFPAKGAAVLDSQALMMTSINLNAKS
jgi:polyphosphate kinase